MNIKKEAFYEQEFFSKTFEGPTMKAAYMKAAKWIATNVISKEEFRDVNVNFEKGTDKKFPSITVHLFAVLNETETEENHCRICKESHKSFFMNDRTSCDSCKTKAYQKRLNDMLNGKKLYFRELITKQIKQSEGN